MKRREQSSVRNAGKEAIERGSGNPVIMQHVAFSFDTEAEKACNLHVPLDPPAETK
jgi:hypothetical protein